MPFGSLGRPSLRRLDAVGVPLVPRGPGRKSGPDSPHAALATLWRLALASGGESSYQYVHSLALTPSPPVSGYEDVPRGPARILAWLFAQRWLLAIFGGALAVRLHWNLEVHPLGDYVYSDMHGYVARAERLLREFPKPHEYSAFFPFGTHWMVAAVKYVAPERNEWVLSVLYAVMGATTVAMAYAVARRVSGFRIVPPAVGLLGIFYYPHFSIGGYILSETPYCLFLMGAVLSVLRLADTGRTRDAIALGLFAGVGTLFRPQLLLSAAFVGLYWIARRKSLPNIKLKHLLLAGVPLALCVGMGSYHLHHNTGRYGLISENGSFNLVFGRCHNSKIESLPDGEGHGKVHFRPPPFLQVANAVLKSKRTKIPPDIALDPAFEDVFSYRGYIGDSEQHHKYIKACLKETGPATQLAYSWTNVQLLWMHNIPWPDSGRAAWRLPATWWTYQHQVWLMFPALLGLLWLVVPGPQGARRGLVALQIFSLLLLAAVFFGGTRHRVPYDLLLIVLAFETYAVGIAGAWRLVRAAIQRVGGGGAGIGGGAAAGAARPVVGESGSATAADDDAATGTAEGSDRSAQSSSSS